MSEDKPKIGDIEIFAWNDWIPLRLDDVLYLLSQKRVFPQAREWDGNKWNKKGLRILTQHQLASIYEHYEVEEREKKKEEEDVQRKNKVVDEDG